MGNNTPESLVSLARVTINAPADKVLAAAPYLLTITCIQAILQSSSFIDKDLTVGKAVRSTSAVSVCTGMLRSAEAGSHVRSVAPFFAFIWE